MTLNSNTPFSVKPEIHATKMDYILFFAPIAQHPFNHGGSIRSIRLFEEFCKTFDADGLMIGSNFDYSIHSGTGQLIHREPTEKSKASAAIGSLIHSEHYLKEKQMSPDLNKRFFRALDKRRPDALFMSYLYCSTLLEEIPDNVPIFIDTHNDDWEWFSNIQKATGNPLVSKICKNSLQKTDEYVDSVPSGVSLLHVSQSDFETYREHRPDLSHYLVPNGCKVKVREAAPEYSDKLKRLIFVGSLSSQMNVDALSHLRDHFWETLKSDARLTVIGSNPGSEVTELCKQQGWQLIANATDEQLDEAYERSHFALLPFAYGAGSKLKLAEACGRGVPVLSTAAGSKGFEPPLGVLVSDSPQKWHAYLQSFEYTNEDQASLVNYAERNSWQYVASSFQHDLLDQNTALELEIDDSTPQKILIHDFGGYPFIIEASRQLALLGHEVEHHYVSLTSQDRENLEKFHRSTPNLKVVRQKMSEAYPKDKYSLSKRVQHEIAYGINLGETIKNIEPDVVISANAPSHLQSRISQSAKACNATFIAWMQDFYSLAVARHLEKKIPIFGGILGKAYMSWERAILRESKKVAIISDDFSPRLRDWGIQRSQMHTIHNWASIEKIPVLPKENEWSRSHNLHDKYCFIYTGTMGLKHNPDTLVALADSFMTNDDVAIIVIGEGQGIDYLREQNLPNLHCLPFQDYEVFPQVLASADVLTALLEPDAGQYSVPSKVLSYLCASRPILLSVPEDNLAARIVTQHDAGLVAAPEDTGAFVDAAQQMYWDRESMQTKGAHGRQYAEQHFDPEQIARYFGKLIESAA